MNFIEAVKAALDDNKIRRKDWYHTHYIHWDGLTLKFGCFKKQFVFDDLKKSYAEYLEAEKKYKNYLDFERRELIDADYVCYMTKYLQLDVRDYLADDWEIVNKKLHQMNTGNFQWNDWKMVDDVLPDDYEEIIGN
jgi:hypothetical protein